MWVLSKEWRGLDAAGDGAEAQTGGLDEARGLVKLEVRMRL